MAKVIVVENGIPRMRSTIDTLTIGNLNFTENTISSINENGHIRLSPEGTGRVDLGESDLDFELDAYLPEDESEDFDAGLVTDSVTADYEFDTTEEMVDSDFDFERDLD